MTQSPQISKQFWAIIPAAGVGRRMNSQQPKQYLSLHQKTVIEHSLQRMLDVDAIAGAVIALGKTDEYWQDIPQNFSKPVHRVEGGKERYDSVLNALLYLQQHLKGAATENWVLVHDAARPCVRESDINKLINAASQHDNGGLLASPVRDTMKRQQLKGTGVDQTVDRNGLYHALTPQMFKLDLLIRALQNARQNGQPVTDDASAMELAGYHPQLVEGHDDNIKITRPFDLTLAGLYMQEQMKES